MNFFSSWVLSIVGISLVGVLSDLVICGGKMKGLVKTVVAIFTILAIVSPIKELKINDIESIFSNLEVDSEFVEKYEGTKLEKLKEDIEKNLSDIGYFGVKINFEIQKNNTICKVYVDLKGLVLMENGLNINKYTNIVAVVKNFVNIDREDIIFYE